MFHFRRFKKQEYEGNFGKLFVARLIQEFKNINMRDFGYNFIVEIRRVTFYTMADYRSKWLEGKSDDSFRFIYFYPHKVVYAINGR